MSKRLADVVSLCAFADEADPNLAGQIRALQENGIGLIELRGVNGTNVAALTAEQAKEIRRELDAGGVKVWALGSPAGKSKITQDFAVEEEQFKRLLETADLTGAACIRLFSFYGTDGKAECRSERTCLRQEGVARQHEAAETDHRAQRKTPDVTRGKCAFEFAVVHVDARLVF
jgi:hypothetical protein